MQGRIVIIRHAETQWSINGRHTGSTDLPLTAAGRIKGELIGSALSEFRFDSVWTSPLRRAADTCRLAGLGDVARTRSDLVEWDYGDYEGITTAEIIETRPGWDLWLHGAPGGESPDDVARRVDTLVAELARFGGDVAIFSHGHLSRALAVRWVGLPIEAGRLLALGTGTISVLSWQRDVRVIARWNDDSHLRAADAAVATEHGAEASQPGWPDASRGDVR